MTDAVNPEHEQHPEAFFSLSSSLEPRTALRTFVSPGISARDGQHSSSFLQWISPEWINEHNVLQSIYWGLRWEPTGLSEERQRAPLHLLSASLSAEQLGALAP